MCIVNLFYDLHSCNQHYPRVTPSCCLSRKFITSENCAHKTFLSAKKISKLIISCNMHWFKNKSIYFQFTLSNSGENPLFIENSNLRCGQDMGNVLKGNLQNAWRKPGFSDAALLRVQRTLLRANFAVRISFMLCALGVFLAVRCLWVNFKKNLSGDIFQNKFRVLQLSVLIFHSSQMNLRVMLS